MAVVDEIGSEPLGSKRDPRPSADVGNLPASYADPDGDSVMRLIEASWALHRAAIALEGMGPGTLAQLWTRYRQTPDGESPSPLDATVGSMSVLDDIGTAMTHVDKVNTTIAGAATELGLATTLIHPEEIRGEPVVGIILVGSPATDPLPGTIQRVGDDLNRSTMRGIFEVALILQQTLEYDSDPEVVQGIKAAIELLDDTIQETRTIVFGLQNTVGSRMAP